MYGFRRQNISYLYTILSMDPKGKEKADGREAGEYVQKILRIVTDEQLPVDYKSVENFS